MPAATTDLLKKYKSLFSTTLSVGISTGTGDTITPASVSGLPTDTLITLTFDRVDSGGVATPTKLERIQGIISGGNFTSYTRGIDGTTEQAHAGGAVIEMIWNADDWNDLVTWGLTEHNQLGGHTNITASNITASATTSSLHYKVIAAGDFLDANGNELLKFTQTASAVNELTIGNAITASDVTLTASGGDTDVGLNLVPKGAGTIKVSGTAIPSATSTTTFTNKRIEPRIVSAASYTTDTGSSLSVATADEFVVTAQAGALLFNAPGGTPVEGQKLVIRIKDNGTARALTWNAVFRAMGTALPSTTVLSKTLYLGFIYNYTDTKWDLVASAQEA